MEGCREYVGSQRKIGLGGGFLSIAVKSGLWEGVNLWGGKRGEDLGALPRPLSPDKKIIKMKNEYNNPKTNFV